MFGYLIFFSYEVNKCHHITSKSRKILGNHTVCFWKRKSSNISIVLTSVSGGIHITVGNSIVPYLMLGWVSNENQDIRNLTIVDGNEVILFLFLWFHLVHSVNQRS